MPITHVYSRASNLYTPTESYSLFLAIDLWENIVPGSQHGQTHLLHLLYEQ